MRRVRPQQVLRYRDETLADGTIYRRYEDGRAEWRTRVSRDVVRWRDNTGREGIDERLARGLVKRTSGVTVAWGRENGFGRTAWEGGRMVTVNTTPYGGRVGTLLAAAAGAALIGTILAPPDGVDAAFETLLRDERSRRVHGAEFDPEFDDLGDDDVFGDDLGDAAGDDAFG